MTEKKGAKDVRPQWLVYEEEGMEQAIASQFVSSILMVPISEDRWCLAITAAGGMGVKCGDMTQEQCRMAAKHVRFALSLPESVEGFSGLGLSMPLHKVIEGIKERMPESLIALPSDLH